MPIGTIFNIISVDALYVYMVVYTNELNFDFQSNWLCKFNIIMGSLSGEKTEWILIRWLHQKTADPELHCFIKGVKF